MKTCRTIKVISFMPSENISQIELSGKNKESFSSLISVGQPNPFYWNVISFGDILFCMSVLSLT